MEKERNGSGGGGFLHGSGVVTITRGEGGGGKHSSDTQLKVLSGIFTFSTQRTLSKGLRRESIYLPRTERKMGHGEVGRWRGLFKSFQKSSNL